MVQAIGILGPGRLGRSLAISLEALGFEIHTRARDDETTLAAWLADLEVVLMTVRDDQLQDAITAMAEVDLTGKTVIMSAGAVPLEVLAPLGERGAITGKFHPLQAFTDPRGRPVPEGTPWAIEGPIRDLVAPMVAAWGGTLYELSGEDWARYHLAAVFSANFLPLFIRAGARILAPLTRTPDDAIAWLEPLVRRSVEDALDAENPLPYSGPAVRGDVGVLEGQVAMLDQIDSEWAMLYRLASDAVAHERDRT